MNIYMYTIVSLITCLICMVAPIFIATYIEIKTGFDLAFYTSFMGGIIYAIYISNATLKRGVKNNE